MIKTKLQSIRSGTGRKPKYRFQHGVEKEVRNVASTSEGRHLKRGAWSEMNSCGRSRDLKGKMKRRKKIILRIQTTKLIVLVTAFRAHDCGVCVGAGPRVCVWPGRWHGSIKGVVSMYVVGWYGSMGVSRERGSRAEKGIKET